MWGFRVMDFNCSSYHPRVLVVDDEPLLRSFNADVLSDAGFTVLEAGNADEALALLARTDDIRVVFTDVEMPGRIDGFALAAKIGTLWPAIGVLVTSGRRLPHESFEAPMRCFVPKPYKASQLVDLIDAIVHAHHAIVHAHH